jgi:hypothetical protein
MRRLAHSVLAFVFPLTLGFVAVEGVALIARGPTVATFDGTSCPAGVYTITALASDLAGHNYPSLPVTVTLPSAQVQVPWPNLPPGQYSALARAQHADGRAWNSEIVTVSGQGDPVPAPTPDPVVTPVPVPTPVPTPPTPPVPVSTAPPLPAGSQALLTTQVPDGDNFRDGNGITYELGVRLRSDVTGTLTALRFWKPSLDAGVHTGRVWTTAGQLLASVTFANETASGWQQQALTPALPLPADTDYVVTVSTGPAGYYVSAVQAGSSFAAAVTNGHLTAGVGAGVLGPLGSFPTLTNSQQANYFRDVVFVADAAPAPSPPTVDLTAVLQAIQLSTQAVLDALKPAPTVSCTVTASAAAYANSDQKLTVRCPPGSLAVNQVIKVIK